MKFFSTRDHDRIVTASQAIAQGLSDEGGLFVPERFPQVDVRALCQLDYPTLAAAVVSEYLTDYSKDFLTEATRTTYGEAFGGKAGYLAPVEGDTYALELWHGPTCAFKDYALQLMPKLLVEAKKNLSRTEKTLILVATSGDTGKAALDGYHDIPGVEIAVFYPTGGTSEIQRLQMATQEGANVAVYAVRGNFDDAQTGVKRVFGDKTIAAKLAERNIRLSSANSINWGRLVPQIVYYFAAYAQLLKAGKIAFGDEVDFCVPTGNFGDILAGYYAKQMGLPVGRLVCASNQNNVLTDFLSTGTYTAKREFYKTTSPSMDILVSSNLERLLYHVTGSDVEVTGLMKSLNETGSYTVRPETLAAIRESFDCGWSSEEQVAGEIRARYEKDGYLCDTHTAVAFHVAAQKKRDGVPMVVLSTASPFKFPRSVLEALGHTAPENDFEAMRALEEATVRTAPASLAALRQKAERFSTVIDPAGIAEVALGYQA
ncbi:threonine synthase [Faecalibacterium sp.]|uniref:threonine synthase n=1 Tax=Faecalibacterium sp. TaxID=1971605 RepID=UPI00399AB123